MPPNSTSEGQATLAAAKALLPQIRAAADEIELGRRLPMTLVNAMREAGIFRMAMPRAWGGPELDAVTQLQVLEALAYADGSVGWCAMINIDGGYMSAFLDQDVAHEMFADLDAPTGASILSVGKAEPVDGGYRVNGRWAFVSGCQHCKWIVVTCAVEENGSPKSRPDGGPVLILCFIPAADGEILDTWHTTGLRGSGSHDFTARAAFVATERTCPFPMTSRRKGALYAFPMLFGYKVGAIPIGIARAAIDRFAEAARRKNVTIGNLTGRNRLLAEEAYVQSSIGRAEALVGAARSYIYERMEDIWRTLEAGQRLAIDQRVRYRLAVINAHQACLEAVEMLYKSYGGAAVYASGPLDRALRDLQTINQHTINSLKVYETAGRMLLGMELRASDILI
ncbi:MAG TPA: acyl-CoA dehydrogenase family protein [Candidatus Binataceae bacterium]|nr:acyl-CoA dehydrogenase family protein [Candidatus Binataceae bacterium]